MNKRIRRLLERNDTLINKELLGPGTGILSYALMQHYAAMGDALREAYARLEKYDKRFAEQEKKRKKAEKDQITLEDVIKEKGS